MIIRYPEDNGAIFESFRYPAGEIQIRINPSRIGDVIKEKNQIAVVATIKDGEVMGLALLADAIHQLNGGRAETVLVLPYMPYARADRRFTDGDCYGLKVFGRMIDSMAFCRVVTFDVHSAKSHGNISNLMNVEPNILVKESLRRIGNKDAVLLFPDEGANRRYEDLTGVNVLSCEKNRDPKTGALLGFTVPPDKAFAGVKKVLIVDDICDGGGTFIGIADALSHLNLDLYLYATHGIFSKGFTELGKRFKKIFTTDSLGQNPNPLCSVFPVGDISSVRESLAVGVK